MIIEERYLNALRELTQEQEDEGIPDKLKLYTHDVKGKKLPCEYVQLNQQYVHHLNKIPKHLEAGNDYFGLCFGYPGSGKTHTMIRTCLYLNADFGLKDIFFTPNQMDEWITHAPKGSVGLFDEADVIGNNHYDQILRSIIRQSKRIRTRQLVIFFNTPSMRDMHAYFAFRAKMIIYCYVPENTQPNNRGWLHLFHHPDLISDLFARMKKAYSENSRVYNAAYSTLKNKYIGRQVPPDWPINEDEYEAKKEQGRKELEKEGGLTTKQALNKQRNDTIKKLHNLLLERQIRLDQQDLANAFNLSRTRYSDIINDRVEKD